MTQRSPRRVSFFDATAENTPLRTELLKAAARVIDSGRYVLGEEVACFEAALAERLGVEAGSVIGVSCGTDALILSLLAAGVGPGDEVIVPAYTFISPASAALWVGATPVFADVDPQTLTIDPEEVAALLGPRTRAVIPVHLFGRPADLSALAVVLREAPQPVAVIEDLAQALGARWDGHEVGTLGALGAVSFFPTKNLGGFGDGGAVIARDLEVAREVRALRVHGCHVRYEHARLGLNARLDAMSAALLAVKLPGLDAAIAHRRAAAHRYRALIEGSPLATLVRCPSEESGAGFCVYNQFVVRAAQRDALRAHLADHGVETQVYYPRALPEQPVFAAHAPRRRWPHSEAAARDSLALPIAPGLDADAQSYVVEVMAGFFASRRSAA